MPPSVVRRALVRCSPLSATPESRDLPSEKTVLEYLHIHVLTYVLEYSSTYLGTYRYSSTLQYSRVPWLHEYTLEAVVYSSTMEPVRMEKYARENMQKHSERKQPKNEHN